MMVVFYNQSLIFILLLVVLGMSSFCLNGKHLLSLLLSLEVIMMGLYSLSVLCICYMAGEIYYSLVVLTFAACEAAIGLSVLVNMVNSHGSNHVTSFNLSQC